MFNITLKYEGKFYNRKKIWKTQAHIHFDAPLLLSDMKWEVAYSTLCTDFFFFFLENCTSIYTWQAYTFTSLICDNTHTKHTNTQTYVNQIWEECMTAAVSNWATGPTGFRKQGGGSSRIFVAREDTYTSVNRFTLTCVQLQSIFLFFPLVYYIWCII